MIEAPETCDGSNFGTATCGTEGFTGGNLTCTATCTIDTSSCTNVQCGDGNIDGTEVCDGANLNNETCETRGFLGGTLACAADCLSFDESACTEPVCGNDVIEGTDEVCDGVDLNSQTCETRNYLGGTLACAADCSAFDESACYDYQCGDGDINALEACDGANLNNQTCETLGHFGGPLACDADCLNFDETACYESVCGNGTVEDAEVCDGTNLAGETCATQGFDYGVLVCTNCTAFDTTGCANSGTGQSCTDFYYIGSLPFTVDGTSIAVDYTNDHSFNSATNCGTGNGMEAVFAIELLANETIRLAETGGLDAVIRVLDICDDTTGTCLISSDTPETVFFTAPADGFYFIVLEAFWANAVPPAPDYNFAVELAVPEAGNCGDGVDNDLDGDIDCGDADCFGDTTHCSTEALCADGLDNDADGATDCADGDCSTSPACGGGTQLLFEDFSTWPPANWTIENGGGDGIPPNYTWEQCIDTATNDCDHGDFDGADGADGAFAVMDSDASGENCVEGLVTPSIDCSAYTAVALMFDHYFRQFVAAEHGEVQVSTDGGTTYTTVALYDSNTPSAGEHIVLDISALAGGQSDVIVRFLYTGDYAWYWMVDSVGIFAL